MYVTKLQFLLGNQIRNYDVNALYLALEDVRKGISIYRLTNNKIFINF